MRIILRNSDVVASYKAAFISSMIAKSLLKKKFFDLVDGSLWSTRTDGVPYDAAFVFNSPINDGWLNSAKDVASFFFPTYTYGLKHWDGTLDHLWPVVYLIPFSADERNKFSKYLRSSSDVCVDAYYSCFFACDYYGDGLWITHSHNVASTPYVENEIIEHVVLDYDELGNVSGEHIEYETRRVFFFYDWRKMRDEMSSNEFLEWFLVSGRIDQLIEYEDGGFFDTVFGKFVSGLLALATGGPVGLAIWIGTKFAIEIYGDIVEDDSAASSSTTAKEEMLWSSDDDEYLSDNIMAVPPLPRY